MKYKIHLHQENNKNGKWVDGVVRDFFYDDETTAKEEYADIIRSCRGVFNIVQKGMPVKTNINEQKAVMHTDFLRYTITFETINDSENDNK